MGAKLSQRGRGGGAAALRLRRQHLDRAIHADGEDLVDIGQVGIDLAVPDEGAIAADAGLDGFAVLGMRADLAREVQEHERLFEVHGVRRPAFRKTCARRLRRLLRRVAALDIRPEAAGFQRDLRAAILAENPVRRAVVVAVQGREGAGVAAIGIVRAADEGPARSRRLEAEPPLAAGRAEARIRSVRALRIEMGREEVVDLLQHLADPQIGGLGDGGGEVAPEARKHVLVVAVARRDLVELVLEIGGEVVFDIAAEEVGEECRDEPALVLRDQAVLVLPHIVAVLDRGDDRGIGGGPADAELLHPLHERRLGIARRCLREMLGAENGPGPVEERALRAAERAAAFLLDHAVVARSGLREGRVLSARRQGRPFARHDLRKPRAVLVGIVVAALVVDLEEPVEEHDLAGGAQLDLAVGAADVDGRAFEPGGLHLAGEGALPDQVVELLLLALGADRVGREAHVGRADAFMRFLRVLGLVLVDPRRGGDIVGAEAALDLGARGRHRLGRHVDAVGPHVGDVAGLVEALGGRHAGLGTHAELAAGLLLQGRGHEGRVGVAARRLGIDGPDREIARGDRLDGQFRRGLVGDVELVEPLAAEDGEAGLVVLPARRRQRGGDGPVFARPERLDLHLALDDEAEADRLDPAGGFRAGELAPEDGREVEADEVVERAAGEVGLDQRGVDVAGMGHRLGHGGFGDRVEGDAADCLALLQARGERFLEVPGNRLALAVGVGGENERVVGLQRLGDRADVLFAVRGDFPFHVESVLGIDRSIPRRKVADMAVGGEDGVVGAEILVDCLGLGGRFYDDNGHDFLLKTGLLLWARTMWGKGGECQ